MAHVQLVDELVREYLVHRGLAATVKQLDVELRTADKERGFRADRVVEHLVAAVNSHDLAALRELWAHLDARAFSKLEAHFAPAARKFEASLYKYYLAVAVAAGRHDKAVDFFAKMTPELQAQPEWREWYALPYVARPEEHPAYSACFGRQWQDALVASLHNFVATVFQCAPQPTLAAFEAEAAAVRRLRDENAALRARCAELEGRATGVGGGHRSRLVEHRTHAPAPLIDDFYIVPATGAAANHVEGAVREARGLRGLIRQMGGGGSPVLGKKQTRSLSQH